MIIENEKWLKSEADIVEHFKEDGAEYFDCGQGYSQDKAVVIAKVGEDYYLVTMEAGIGSQWQDRGEKLYYVETIEEVTYEKVSYDAVVEIENKQVESEISSLEHKIAELRKTLIS